MPQTPSSPGVYIEEAGAGGASIAGLAGSIALFVGWAASGPANQAQPVKSFADYQRDFGPLDRRSALGYAVQQFFGNGGSEAYVLRLQGAGADGTPLSPGSADFHAALLAQLHAGQAFDRLASFNLLCVPGESDAATLAALQSYCQQRHAFLIADAPAADRDGSLSLALAAQLSSRPAAAFSALYFPWVKAADPLQNMQELDFPPCGFVAGVYAASEAEGGVWKTPDGILAGLNGASGLSAAIGQNRAGELNQQGINCLRSLPNLGPVVWGARTLAGRDELSSDWKYVSERRLANYIETSLLQGTQWTAFEPNGEALWARLRLSISAFMQTLFQQGAFMGASPQEAYFVKCDATTTSPADIEQGMVSISLGFAPRRPAEFLILTLRQRAGGSST